MKQKIYSKVINGCEDCPNYEVYKTLREYKCFAGMTRKRDLPEPTYPDFHTDFPEWCPLEDFDL